MGVEYLLPHAAHIGADVQLHIIGSQSLNDLLQYSGPVLFLLIPGGNIVVYLHREGHLSGQLAHRLLFILLGQCPVITAIGTDIKQFNDPVPVIGAVRERNDTGGGKGQILAGSRVDKIKPGPVFRQFQSIVQGKAERLVRYGSIPFNIRVPVFIHTVIVKLNDPAL